MLWFIPNRYAVVLKDTCRAAFSCALVSRRNLKTPGLSISRIFTEEGPPVFLRLSHSEVNPAPAGPQCRLRLHLNTCIPDGYPPARFSGHGTLYRVAANCSDPRIASGHHGGGQCDPQPLLWCSVPAFCIPHTAGGSEGTLYLPSASGCHSRALRPAVLPPGGEACVSRKTLSPAQLASDSLGVHKELLVAVASFIPPTARAPCRNARRR